MKEYISDLKSTKEQIRSHIQGEYNDEASSLFDHSWVSVLTATNNFQKELHLHVTEHQPLAFLGKGKYLTQEGRIISPGKRKEDLNQYIYSLIQVKDQNLAQELYLKLESNESEFSTLAKEYSLGPEKYRNGIEGPILLSNINPKIKDILKSTDKGLVCEPFNINDTWIVIRLDEIIYAELNESMKKILSNELLELFLEKLTREIIEEIREKSFSEKFKY